MIDIKVPVLGESITTATVAKIHKNVGDFVQEDEIILELETEKINLEITATSAGKVAEITVSEEQEVTVDELVAKVDETVEVPAQETAKQPEEEQATNKQETKIIEVQQEQAVEKEPKQDFAEKQAEEPIKQDLDSLSPAVRSLVIEHNIDIAKVDASGRNGRILKSDILEFLENKNKPSGGSSNNFSRNSYKEKTPNLRKTIAKRLKESQNTAAMLTTFNEVDMSNVMKFRKNLKEDFAAKNGVGLGFMSFFTKAVCKALQEYKAVNAYWLNDEIEYHDYCDISIAVASEKGLFVPVIRNAESLSFAEIEKTIKSYGQKAKEGSLTAADMQGGTFSITNGGIFGSMLSTPIINQPQSAILGMHNIVERAVVVDGQIVVRPIMYVALSYDHRIIDGAQAVSFLVKVKELLENPEKLMLDNM